MQVLCLSILGRSIGCGTAMIDPMLGTPACHSVGNKFTVIGDEGLQSIFGLVCDSMVPQLKDR